MTNPVHGFGLAPSKREGGMYSYDLGRELTPEEQIVARQKMREAAEAKAVFDRSLRGRVANFFTVARRGWAAFKGEDTGL
jgi:hypothetical protein